MNLFKKWLGTQKNSYLTKHGYYDSFHRKSYRKSYGRYPYLPYSLVDLLDLKNIRGRQIYVCFHGDTARWFAKRGNSVTLGRSSHSHMPSKSIRYHEAGKNYDGSQIDILILDHKVKFDFWEDMSRKLNSKAVVIILGDSFDIEGSELYDVSNDLEKLKWKMLKFRNPGPMSTDEMVAEFWYQSDNVLDV